MCSRVNIGNARLYRLEKDLGLKGNQFQTAVALLFVPYIICEVPSNMVLKKFTPRIWLALLAFGLGLISTCTGLVNNFGQLIACRLLLGAAEAGLFPGIVLYFSIFYTPNELGFRVSILLVSVALAGAVSGLCAFGIGHMQGLQGKNGWRWILILEGIPSMVLSAFIFLLLPNNPASAKFLKEDERELIKKKMEGEQGQTAAAQKFILADGIKALVDWKVWLMTSAHFGILVMIYGASARSFCVEFV